MARMTQAELQAQEEIRVLEQWATNVAEYRINLFGMLHTAVTKLGWEVIPTPFDELKVLVSDYRNTVHEVQKYTFPMELKDALVQLKMERMEQDINFQMERLLDAERQNALRASAYAKLTGEEIAALRNE